jgi:hypothetical protein
MLTVVKAKVNAAKFSGEAPLWGKKKWKKFSTKELAFQ